MIDSLMMMIIIFIISSHIINDDTQQRSQLIWNVSRSCLLPVIRRTVLDGVMLYKTIRYPNSGYGPVTRVEHLVAFLTQLRQFSYNVPSFGERRMGQSNRAPKYSGIQISPPTTKSFIPVLSYRQLMCKSF